MGVDYFACAGCPETYPDCSDYFLCTTCERGFCDGKCGAKQVPEAGAKDRYGQEISTCRFCRNETIEDEALLNWALGRLGMDRTEVESRFLGALKTPDVIDAADALAKAAKATFGPTKGKMGNERDELGDALSAYLQLRP